MSKKEEQQRTEQEEPIVAPPDDFRPEPDLSSEEQQAVEAMRKFTDEDDDEMGQLSVKSILGGDFLMSKFMMKQVIFVMFCALLMILYTANRYDSQQDVILIDSLRNHLQEVKYNVLTQSSELMNLTRQSNVERMLKDTPDSLLHNSITPPFLIKSAERRKPAAATDPEEVLVDTTQKSDPQDEDEDI